MEQVTGQTARQLQHELGGLVYRNPEGAWETADQYLSGDVRAKLASARSATALDAAYQRNIEALEAVQPPDLQPGEIEARLGSSWVPATDICGFVAQLLDIAPDNVRVAHAEAIATWTLEINSAARWDVSNTTTYGTARFRASDLIEDALNGRTPTAYDEREDGSRVVNQQETIAAREKLQQVKDRFREWVWEDPERASRLAREYNDRFNNLRLRTFDGSHLTLPGMVREPLRDHDLGSSPERRGLARPAKRQHASGPCCRRGKDLDDGGIRYGNAPPGPCQETNVRRAQPSGRAVGRRIPEALSAGQALHRGQGPFLGRQPAARDGAHRQRQLRRRDRLAPLVRVFAGFGQALQPLHGRPGPAARRRHPRSQDRKR